jgi:tRNA(adenine34) deaminase
MRHCIELARQAKRAGNTAVGSLIAIGPRIVVDVEEETPGGPDRFAHAELLAVRRATERLGRKTFPEAVLYTTVEPCLLCSFAIREARIGRIVIGTSVPHIGGATSPYPILLTADITPWGAPPTIVWGVLQKECEALHR